MDMERIEELAKELVKLAGAGGGVVALALLFPHENEGRQGMAVAMMGSSRRLIKTIETAVNSEIEADAKEQGIEMSATVVDAKEERL